MIACDQVRTALALCPSDDSADLQEHLAQCDVCTSYQQRHQTLDVVLRDELRWEAPANLTARLLALAATPTLVGAAAELAPARPGALGAARPRPERWYVSLVYVLTASVVVLSLAVAWQFFGILAAQAEFSGALSELLAAPARGLAQMTQALPESRYVIAFFLRVRDQLLWLLLVAVLWAALDKWNPQLSLRRSQLSS